MALQQASMLTEHSTAALQSSILWVLISIQKHLLRDQSLRWLRKHHTIDHTKLLVSVTTVIDRLSLVIIMLQVFCHTCVGVCISEAVLHIYVMILADSRNIE